MDSPGQRRGSCGHKMAGFDMHEKCARCRDKGLGKDPCIVGGAICKICDNFTAIQREMLATPQYQIRKDKKAGLLVSPRDVTVLSPVNSSQQPASTAHAQQTISEDDSAHAQDLPGGSDNVSSSDFVSKKDFDKLSDQLDEKFSRFEALLSRGNIFATPKVPVQVSNPPVSDQPFIDPASARTTGPVRFPAVQASTGSDGKKDSKKKHKSSHHKSSKTKPVPVEENTGPVQKKPSDTALQQAKPVPVGEMTGPVRAYQTDTFVPKEPVPVVDGSFTGPEPAAPAGEPFIRNLASAGGSDNMSNVEHPLTDVLPVASDEPLFGDHTSTDVVDRDHTSPDVLDSEDGELSESDTDKPEKNEEMSYRETVRSIRAFMGWNFIPDFEFEYSDPDKSNNPWRGKNPKTSSKVSVAMPADDWLCQKLERINLTVAEGYPSRSQEAGGLRTDQFIRTPKPQDKWYPMHKLKTDGPQRPGRKLFNWHGSEAKLNAQFSRIVKPAAYLATGPVSRPISQEVLRRWERCAREGTYTVNHAAGFSRCTSEIQDQMAHHITFLQTHLSKGKSAKEVSEALKELRDLCAFHQNVSVSLGTALQHLADSLFVQLGNFILMRRDSYLDHVRPGMKMDTWNELRNAALFGYGLFPDAALNVAEQDINKFETQHVSVQSRVGPQHQQKTKYRYKPYEKKEAKTMVQPSSAPQQPWRQFGSRGRGRGRGSTNHRFSKYARGGKNYK